MRVCTAPGCDRKHQAKGYCRTHYYQMRRNGVVVEILSPGRVRSVCTEEGCSETAMARGWCATHYRELHYRYAKYGLTAKQYDEMIEAQGGCAICHESVPKGRQHVDHDHSCCPGQTSCGACVRGILCDTCNVGLGMFSDDIQRLQAAIDYLKEPTKGDT